MAYNLRWKDRYTSSYTIKTFFKYAVKAGLSCSELVEKIVEELRLCEKHPATPIAYTTLPADKENAMIQFHEIISAWVRSRIPCIAPIKMLKVDGFPVITTKYRLNIYKLKDIVCVLKDYKCISDKDFEELKRDLKRVCKTYKW
jgi:hypothetical protein